MGTVDTLLDEHVSFRCTSVDRIGVRGYVQGLQYEGGVVKFLLNRGVTIPSPVRSTAITNARRRARRVVESTGVPVVRFKTGDAKKTSPAPTKTRPR